MNTPESGASDDWQSWEAEVLNSPHSDKPSNEQQLQLLRPILGRHMRELLMLDNILERLKLAYESGPCPLSNSFVNAKGSNDTSLVVARWYYRRNAQESIDSLSPRGECLQIGIMARTTILASQVDYVNVASRYFLPDGPAYQMNDYFDLAEGVMIGDMVDELDLVRISGQIPDLDPQSLHRLRTPTVEASS